MQLRHKINSFLFRICETIDSRRGIIGHLQEHHSDVLESVLFYTQSEQLTVNSVNYYQCSLCQVDSIAEDKRRKHHFRNHKAIYFEWNISKYTKTLEQVQCHICKFYTSDQNIRIHMILHHMPALVKKMSDVLPLSAMFESVCDENMAVISMVFKCGICGANGIMERNLNFHHSSNHRNVPFQIESYKFSGMTLEVECEICGKQLKENIIDKHMELFHIELYQCKVCKKSDIEIQDLNRHHLKYHDDISTLENIFRLQRVEQQT